MTRREEAIKTLKENCCAMCAYGSQDMDSCDIRSCDNKEAIKTLEQEQKTGQWEWVQCDADSNIGNYYCSVCFFIPAMFSKHLKFCPNCGAKMQEDDQ